MYPKSCGQGHLLCLSLIRFDELEGSQELNGKGFMSSATS